MSEDINPHYERLEKYRVTHAGKGLAQLAEAMDDARNRKAELEERLKEVNAEFDVLRLELVPGVMEADGIERAVVSGVGRVTLTGDMHVRVSDLPTFYEWLHENGLQDLIKETVAPATLKAFAKGRIKEGKELPESVSVSPFTRASITKV